MQMIEIQSLHRQLQGIMYDYHVTVNTEILRPQQYARSLLSARPHAQNDYGIGAAIGESNVSLYPTSKLYARHMAL